MLGKGGGELSVVLDTGLPGEAEAEEGSHQSCLQDRGAGLGVHAAPRPGTHPVVVEELEK